MCHPSLPSSTGLPPENLSEIERGTHESIDSRIGRERERERGREREGEREREREGERERGRERGRGNPIASAKPSSSLFEKVWPGASAQSSPR